MVDFDDVLTTEDGLKQLTKGQRKEFEELCEKFPGKRPIPSMWSNQDELRLRTDYFKRVLEIEGNFQYSPEVSELLKLALSNQEKDNLPQSDWTEFNKKCKEIFSDFDASEGLKQSKNFAGENKEKTTGSYSKDTSPIKIKTIPWIKTDRGLAIIATIGAVATIAAMPTIRMKVLEKATSSKKTVAVKKICLRSTRF